mmetsp:Transcript_22659/g.51097  ORF Transcript_22659/g.51097 Transcript_22659/m.51097 type:complete len:790 (-) Transcript_22659:130-2499(-)
MGNQPSTRGRRRVVQKPKYLKEGEALFNDPRPHDVAASNRYVQGPLERDFELSRRALGSGFSGVVRCISHKKTKEKFALKTFNKKGTKPSSVEMMKNEAEVYFQLDHPHVCRLMYVYEDRTSLHLIMEYCAGQELYDRLCTRKQYSEKDAQEVTLQMLLALQYCHSHKIVHRDLKLENWMYVTPENDAKIKLIDFGFSKIVEPHVVMDVPCGTLHYASPDVLKKSYNSKCDVWSLGVIVYMLLCGSPPFHGKTNREIIDRIFRARLRISATANKWRNVSEQGRDFVQRLLDRDAAARPTAAQALADPWIAQCRKQQLAFPVVVDTLDELERYSKATHLKRAAFSVMAHCLSSKDIDELADPFLAFDEDASGVIKLPQLRAAMKSLKKISDKEVNSIFQTLQTLKPTPGSDADGNAIAHSAVEDEIQYTDFVAGLMQHKIRAHEAKIRMAFDTFDWDSTGYITVENLVCLYGEVRHGVSMEEVIRQVDIKGNGVVDWDEFLHALRSDQDELGIGMLAEEEKPKLRCFGQNDMSIPLRPFARRHVVGDFLDGEEQGSRESMAGSPTSGNNFPCLMTYNRGRSVAGPMMSTNFTSTSEPDFRLVSMDNLPVKHGALAAMAIQEDDDDYPSAPVPLRRTVSDGCETSAATYNFYKQRFSEERMSATMDGPEQSLEPITGEAQRDDWLDTVKRTGSLGGSETAEETADTDNVVQSEFGGCLIALDDNYFSADTVKGPQQVPKVVGVDSATAVAVPKFQRSKIRRMIRTGFRTHHFRKTLAGAAGRKSDAGEGAD